MGLQLIVEGVQQKQPCGVPHGWDKGVKGVL